MRSQLSEPLPPCAVIGGLPARRSGTRTQQESGLLFQKFNADFDLSAKEGADSLAFISLMEEKLRPALVRPRPLRPPALRSRH